MDLKEQRYVCTLAETGSLTQSAERLYISQPALSGYISNLEKNLGVTLFDRMGKKFVPTYAGERYISHAQTMLREADAFRKEMSEILTGQRGRLRIGVSLRRGQYLLPAVVAQYERRWPEIEVAVLDGNLSSINEMLREYLLDMMILNAEDAGDQLETRHLFYEEFLVAVPAVHPLNEKARYVPDSRYRMIEPEELNGQELILQTKSQSSRLVEDEILENYQIVPGRTRIIRSLETAIQFVSEGLGICFIREGFAIHMKPAKPVHYYTLNIENHLKELVIAYRKGLKLPEYMDSMIEMLQTSCSHFPESN